VLHRLGLHIHHQAAALASTLSTLGVIFEFEELLILQFEVDPECGESGGEGGSLVMDVEP
jgi:hypothetical protein